MGTLQLAIGFLAMVATDLFAEVVVAFPADLGGGSVVLHNMNLDRTRFGCPHCRALIKAFAVGNANSILVRGAHGDKAVIHASRFMSVVIALLVGALGIAVGVDLLLLHGSHLLFHSGTSR